MNETIYGGLLTVIEEFKVETVIISKQGENSENYKKFEQIVKDRLKIEKNMYVDILWPNNKKLISENSLNNNSNICKLKYNNFSMMFTGDKEKQ